MRRTLRPTHGKWLRLLFVAVVASVVPNVYVTCIQVYTERACASVEVYGRHGAQGALAEGTVSLIT